MRTLGRILRTTATTLCLLVSLGLLALWPRTLPWADSINFQTASDTCYALGSHPHGISLSLTTGLRRNYAEEIPNVVPRDGWSFTSHQWEATEPIQIRSETLPRPDQPSREYSITSRVLYIEYQWAKPDHYFGGFGWRHETFGTSPAPHRDRIAELLVPIWFASLLFAIPPLIRLGHYLGRRYRLQNNLCTTCGYDLRASSARCPECGTPIPAPAKS